MKTRNRSRNKIKCPFHKVRPAGSKTIQIGHKRGASPGRYGIKPPYPLVFSVPQPTDNNRYLPHQNERECARRVRQQA